MNDIDRRFTVWLSGYYEDFQSMRVISEGEDYATTDFFTNRRDSHAGNTMAAQAFSNPRFAFDYLTRSFANKAPIPLIGSAAQSEAASLHNEGPSQWLTFDPNRIGAPFYEGRATLTYPDTIGDAASLRTTSYARRADYSRFASGWGTQNGYWVRQGDSDSTYGRAGFVNNQADAFPFTNTTRGYGKFDIISLQHDDTSGVPEAGNYRNHKVMHSSSLCGVYLGETGEIATTQSGIGLPYAYLYPIKSPSGKPFFRHSMSRRYADWLDVSSVTDVGGKKQYNINQTEFPNEGSLGSTDQWFILNKKLNTITATGQTYNAGATSITLPASVSPVLDNVLDPANDRHLPDKTGTAAQSIVIGSDSYKFTTLSVGATTISFLGITPALVTTYNDPNVAYFSWEDQASDDNTFNVYNITTAGTPSETPVFQYRQDTSDGLGYPLVCFKDIGNNITTTDARTTNGQSGVQNTPTFTISSTSALGYTYYFMSVSLQSGHSGFSGNPENNFAKDPFFKLGNTYGRLEVGDYITERDTPTPEKITAIANGTITTDGDFDTVNATQVRQATYGSYARSQGRPVDGLHGFQPVIVGDTELNAQADGERFTIRLANQSFNNNASAIPAGLNPTYMLAVGYDQTETSFELNERGNMTGSKAAITHLFKPQDGTGLASSRSTLFTLFEEGTVAKSSYTADQLWYDLDIFIDFTAQSYTVYHDGTAVGVPTLFNTKPGGGLWTAADFYGWSLGVQLETEYDLSDEDSWATIVTMIDRAGYIYALSDRLDGSDDFLIDKFKISKAIDSISQLELTVIDDDDNMSLPQLYSGRPNWKVLLFRDNDYRPIHSAIVANIEWKQNNMRKTKELVMKGKDSIGELDFQFPYFDVGQKDGAPSLVAAYRRYEVTNYANIFHFGATSLLNLNMVLGLDEDSKGSTGEYLPRYDQRMRLYSGHPIQMYNNEEINGPNYVEDAWEVSRRVDYFMPDPNDATKTRAVFTSDAIKYAEDQIPAGVKVAIKGNWRNFGGGQNSVKSLPEFGEKGYLTSTYGASNPEQTPHNEYRGEWTVEQAETVITVNTVTTATSITVADTSLFPASGTIRVGGTGATRYGGQNYAYTSKNATTFFISGTVGTKFGAGTLVRETTATDYIIIDKTWNRSMVVTDIEDNGSGFVQMTIKTDPTSYPNIKYELMGGTGYANDQSVLAKNDKMTPTIAPNDQLFRIWMKPNAAGIAHDANMADFPEQVYTTSTVSVNGAPTFEATFVTTTTVASLSAGLQAALPLTLAAGSGGLADGLECDLAYMTFPKQQESSFTLRNTGSSYAHRDAHARWIRDLPQSLWFQKTFGIMSEYPYGATGWAGAAFTNAAHADLDANFEAGVDTTITLDDTSNFPYAGVCEVWSNDPSPVRVNSDKAVMLTSFAYRGKTATTLTNVMFADANKGVITTTGGAGSRVVIARNISGDYKHCFILWADMRNDGSADADGGRRKDDFGLIHPVQQNYKVSVVWAETGQDFVDLKLGTDCDIWSLNAENDPAGTVLNGSAAAWSEIPSAIMLDYAAAPTLIGKRTDNTELSDHYKNWENKAGAFIVVDLSKFFNVNTEANNGRLAQASGGNKPLGEYLVEGAGTPTLIDSYWYHASATFQNSAQPILQHHNSFRWVTAETTFTADVSSSNATTLINLSDTTDFPARMGVTAFAGQSTAGLIEAKTLDADGNETVTKYVYSYTSKTSTTFTGFKYREVRQSETLDVAAAGLWGADAFTVSGVPAILADGSKVRASLGSAFPMGFMLKVEGKVKSPTGGNYFEHDKIRIYQASALYNDWFKQITLPALSDINNVPYLEDYNVSGNTSGAGTIESFGSVTDGQNKSIFQTMRTLAQAAGVGDGSSLITLNFQMGRDNRMEFRPTYNSGLSLDRNNLKVSNLKASKASSFSHVRVIFNGGESFVTYPSLDYKQNVRFKFVNAVDVASFEQAESIAKQEYQKKKDPSFSVEAEVVRESNETQRVGPMLENARYGYIADPAVQLTGRNGGYWTAGRGGLHFSGQNNALHGNTHGFGRLSLLNYQSHSVLGIGIGGYTGAANFTTQYGTGLAYYPTEDLYNQFPWTQMYYWYGAKSVSYGVQIVHIPKGMPKVSETTGEELRIFIEDKVASIPATDRQTNDTATKLFKIHVADYTFNETQSALRCPPLSATQKGIEAITTKGSGFFEMPIPASYWSAGNAAGYKMVLSVNAEYLNAVARQKTGDQFGGNFATVQTGVTPSGSTLPTFSNANEFSIFPLGIREYPELGSSGIERTAYYAPRIHITDDMNFIPGTYVAYDDSYIDINETMYITKVEYEYDSNSNERTKLHLERESGRMPEGIEGYLATNPFNSTGATGGGVAGGGGSESSGTGGRSKGPGGDTGRYTPPTNDAFPFGYTGGQQGTEPGGDFPPLLGGVGDDLGGVSTPSLGGTNYQRLNTDTGIQQMGQSGALNNQQFNSNNLSDAVIRRLNNSMNMDNLLPNSIQGIPGQPKPMKLSPKVRAMEGVDTKFLSSEGQAAESSEGWVLPGASQLDDSEAVSNPVHSLTLQATTPMDAAHPVIGMTAVVSCEVLSDSAFSLTTTITCEDTGETLSHTYTETMTAAANGISRKTIPLIPQQHFAAANVEGRTLSVSIVRTPNAGSDTANYSSVVIHGVQVQNIVHNNQGTPTTDALAAFAGNEKDTSDISGHSIDVNSNTDPL